MTLRIVSLLLFFTLSAAAQTEEVSFPFDHSLWDQFLKKYVNEKGEVNYREARKDPALLNAYLEKLKSFPRYSFDDWPREEKMALLINAFNAGVVKTVLDHYPVKSIMDIPGGWSKTLLQIGLPLRKPGIVKAKTARSTPPREIPKALVIQSLEEIEVSMLRRSFRNEKILFVLCQGAKGSPRLRQEAYVGPKLEGQLYVATREFVNDAARNRIVPGEKKILLARILQWHAGDFLVNWGAYRGEKKWNPLEWAVLSFLAHYLDDSQKVDFLREGRYKIKYEVFDWRLNEWISSGPGDQKT